MMDKRIVGIALLGLGLGACGLSGDEEGGTGPAPLDPVSKELCHTDLSITGSMVPAPIPAGYPPDGTDLGPTNCWAVGVWTFTAAPRSSNEDGTAQCPSIALLPEYKVEVTRDVLNDGPEMYKFLSSPVADVRLKVSSGGGGLCEGIFEVYSADGKVLHNLHPALQPRATGAPTHVLNGKGEFYMYDLDQRPPAV